MAIGRPMVIARELSEGTLVPVFESQSEVGSSPLPDYDLSGRRKRLRPDISRIWAVGSRPRLRSLPSLVGQPVVPHTRWTEHPQTPETRESECQPPQDDWLAALGVYRRSRWRSQPTCPP